MIVVTTRRYSFRERAPEWILAIGLILAALGMSLEPSLFYSDNYYRPLLDIMPQPAWCFVMAVIGLFRVTALAINGVWRPTAHFRAMGAAAGVTMWGSLLFLSILYYSERPTGISTFGMLLAFDLMALWWSAADAKTVDQLAKRQREIDGSTGP